MKNILLVNIDSTIPNFALKKIEKYYMEKGANIICEDDTDDFSLSVPIADEIFVSCVFSKNKYKCNKWTEIGADIGGSGFDIYKKLPLEIENIKPRINWGFTTRGCIRNCSFCIVPQKEGNVHIIGDLLDLWDGKSKTITIMDNNILAIPEHFFLVCEQAISRKIKIDFNQGLDFRLLTPEIVQKLKQLSHSEYRFAFDDPNYADGIEKAIKLLKSGGINRCLWYVLVGFNTTIEQDLFRLNLLKEHKQQAYVQRYNSDRCYIPIARWANQHHIFPKMSFEKFMELPENFKYKKELERQICEK